eukprot:scaffold3611_cov131-Isochrysis_galbana.AAC.5
MARSCFVRASCASASARSANRLRAYLQTILGSKENHEVDCCLGGSLCRSGGEDADGLVLAGGGGEGEYEGFADHVAFPHVHGVFSSEPTHAAEGAVLGGESSFAGGEGAVDDVFKVGVYVPWREKGGGAAGGGVFPDVVFYVSHDHVITCHMSHGHTHNIVMPHVACACGMHARGISSSAASSRLVMAKLGRLDARRHHSAVRGKAARGSKSE